MNEGVVISSTANPFVKRVRKLRDRKERAQEGVFYAEGLRIVAEAADRPERIETLLVAPELLVGAFGRELVERLEKQGVRTLRFSASVFENFALKEGPQGLAAIIRQEWTPLENVHPKPGESWVVLEAVADPGNLGTILRTHDAVGGKGVILLGQSTDPYDPTSIRASMGAIFSQILVKAQLAEFVEWARMGRCEVIGTSDAAKADYHYETYPDPMILMMGSERQGLSDGAKVACHRMVSIPMLGRGDSLNLAVATAVVLYEWLNQHREIPNR